MYREAEAAFREFTPDVPPSASLQIAYVRAVAGKRQEAEAIIAGQRKSRSPAQASAIPHCYAALGERGRALDWLEQAFSQHDPHLVWAKARPEYDSLRSEPRFAALMQKMGLAP